MSLLEFDADRIHEVILPQCLDSLVQVGSRKRTIENRQNVRFIKRPTFRTRWALEIRCRLLFQHHESDEKIIWQNIYAYGPQKVESRFLQWVPQNHFVTDPNDVKGMHAVL